MTEKRGKIVGGAATEEALASSPAVLAPGRGGHSKGLQQHFSPEALSTFIAAVTGTFRNVVDLTAGDGSLLSAFEREFRFGVELDQDQIINASTHKRGYTSVHGDLQNVFPLLNALNARFDVAVGNPPFGLRWNVPGLGKGSSAELTLRMMRALLRESGLGVFVCGAERFEREVRGLLAPQLFAVVKVSKLFPGVDLPCVVAFWRESKAQEASPVLDLEVASAKDLTEDLAEQVRDANNERFTYWSTWGSSSSRTSYYSSGEESLSTIFSAVQEEHARRTAKRFGGAQYTAMLKGSRVSVYISSYLHINLAKRDRKLIEWLKSFHRQTPVYFALQSREWMRLVRLSQEADFGLSLEPALVSCVEKAISAARRAAIPLYPVSPAQRLGFLTDVDSITCKESDPAKGYEAGTRYPIECSTAVDKKKVQREVQVVREGVEVTDVATVLVEHKAMEIKIGSHTFTEEPEQLQYLLRHFDVPDPGDLAEHFPEQVAFWRAILSQVEIEVQARVPGFRFRSFQKEDVVRLLVKRGGLLAWEQGLGKTLGQGAYVRALELAGRLPDSCAMFVMPQDLTEQFSEEVRRFFGREMVRVATVADALAVEEMVSARRADLKAQRRGVHLAARPGVWAVTWFEALSVAGKLHEDTRPRAVRWGVERDPPTRGHYRYDKASGEDVWVDEVPGKLRFRHLWSVTACPSCGAARVNDGELGWNGKRCTAPLRLNGKPATGRRKVCGHVESGLRVKPAYSVLGSLFRAVLVDEGTKIQGDESLASKAVRAIRADYRVLATGTPVKNFVVQLFWLLWWALRDSSARFPYAYNGGLELFTKDFAVIATTLDEDGKKKGRPRVQPEVTNLMRLWKMLCSSVVRRRMDDVGCVLTEEGEWKCKACSTHQQAQVLVDGRWRRPAQLVCSSCESVWDAIVPLKFVPIHVPMGVEQRRFHAGWLTKKNFVDHFKRKFPGHPLVTCKNADALIAMNAAALGQLAKLGYAAVDPTGDPDPDMKTEALSPWTPGRLEVLRLAVQAVKKGKRVLIGCRQVGVVSWIAERLQDMGVRAEHITEEDSKGKAKTLGPKKRAAIIKRFREGKAEVLVVGAQAVALGHNLDCASVFIGYGLVWDHAGWDQLLKRVRRLSSMEPVTAYVVLPDGSLEEQIWESLQDKGDAADLALDGKISLRREASIDKAACLRRMQEEGARFTGDEVPEAEVEALWKGLLAA